jgi:UDP-glucose 4-epimerase
MDVPAPAAVKHRIVLTGATGGLGRALLAELAARSDCAVLALVRDSARLKRDAPQLQIVGVDYADLKRLEQMVQDFQPTAFIHSAATGMQMPRPAWADMLECNVTLSVRLCELVARLPACRFVFISSGLAYRNQGRRLREDDPLETLHPYAASKAAADLLVRAVAVGQDTSLTLIRPFSFSGIGDTGTRLFPSLLQAAAEGRAFDLSAGEQVRDHCAVADIARGVLLAATKQTAPPPAAEIYNLGSGRIESLRQLVEGVVAELDLQVKLNFGARPATPFEPRFLAADISRAQGQLGWRPQVNFAYAIWELAQTSFPALKLRQPRQHL